MSLIHETYTKNASATGTLTATGQTVVLTFEGHSSASVTLSGTWTGNIVIESSCDGGTTWTTCWFSEVNTNQAMGGIPLARTTLTSENGTFKIFNIAGVTHYRVRSTTSIAWTGTASVYMSAIAGAPTFFYTNSAVVQSVYADSNNSVLDGVTQIAGGATWTGSGTSTLGIAGIQVNIKADKNCTVYLDQSMDGTNWDIVDEYNYYYAKGGASWTTQATGSYYRVRVKNNDSTITSTFRLQTALCPIVEAIPRTLSEEGNLKVGVYEIEDANGNLVGISSMNELRTSEHIRLVGAGYGTTFDTNFWTKAVQTGNADGTVANNVLTLTTGTPTANGNILIQSVRIARYIPSYPNFYRGQVQCPAITGANTRRWGAFDTNNGFFFYHDGTNFAVVCRKGASDANIIYSGSFNGVLGSDYTLDTNNHTYEILYTNSKAIFSIDGKTLHSFSGSADNLTNSLTLNVGLQNVNSGGNTAANLMYVRSSTINRIGKQTATPQWKYQAGAAAGQVLKYGAGTLHRVTVNAWANGSTILLYDALTATNPIALITCTGNVQQPFTLIYELDFYTGLTYTTTNATTNVTFVYE